MNFLGIEIGGTKLQLGVGPGDGTFVVEPCDCAVDRAGGGRGGFGPRFSMRRGPCSTSSGAARWGLDSAGRSIRSRGCTITSHQVAGWDDFPLAVWCREELGSGPRLGQRCRLGRAGRGAVRGRAGERSGFLCDRRHRDRRRLCATRKLYRGYGPAASEIGHAGRASTPAMRIRPSSRSLRAWGSSGRL